MQARLFHLHALSALHCGTGQSVGVVDLPIARARATNLPIVPGSSLRGVLRQHVTGSNKALARTLFGPETITGDQDAFAGALAVGDAHLLALPVRCLAGIVSYATSPFILRRYARDLARAGIAIPALPREPFGNEAVVAPESVNLVDGKGHTAPGDRPGSHRTLVLEDIDLTVRETAPEDASLLKGWATHVAQAVHPGDAESQTESRNDVIRRFALLPDAIMDFLAETATEIRARIAIDPKKGTVKEGALWYEENLPAEAVLWGVYALSDSSNPAEDPRRSEEALADEMPASGTLLQLGGKAGVGRGLVRFLTGHGRKPSAVHEGGTDPEEAPA